MIKVTTHEEAVRLLEERKHLPLRILLRVTGDDYEGEVEHSFSLSWDKRLVGIYWSGTAYDNTFGTTWELDAVKNAERNCAKRINPHNSIAVYDPLSPDCPVAVDLVTWVNSFFNPKANKFDKRNAPFRMKVDAFGLVDGQMGPIDGDLK